MQDGTTEMRPETCARFDLHCVFNKLDYLTFKQIGRLHVNKCLAFVNRNGHAVECETGVVEYIQREGYLERFGARPMQNAAMRVLGSIVVAEMLDSGSRPVRGVVRSSVQTNAIWRLEDYPC